MKRPKIWERAEAALRENGDMTAWQLSQAMGMERPTRGLYAALRSAEDRRDVFVTLVEALHFHGFAGNASQLYSLNKPDEEEDDDDDFCVTV